MSRPAIPRLLALCLLCQGALTIATAVLAREGSHPSRVVLCIAACFIPYAVALAVSVRVDAKVLARLGMVASAVFGVALLFAPPALSDDLYRFVWEGRLWLEGQNPFLVPPDDPSLSALRDADWEPINNKPLSTIYPPLAQVLFALGALLGGGALAPKLVALLGHLFGVWAVGRVSDDARAPLALGLNPLLLGESALNGHFDIVCGTALLLATWYAARGAFGRAAVATCAAVGLKVVGLIGLALLFKRPRTLLAAIVVCAFLIAPLVLWRSPVDPVSGAAQFALRWRGNESLFAGVAWLAGLVFDPPESLVVARTAVAAIVLVLCGLAVRRDLPPLQAMRALTWAVLLLSPQVHPWYLAWLLPLEVAAQGRAGLVWSAAVLLAYAPIDRWMTERVWDMPVALRGVEYVAVAAALALDPRRPSFRRPPEERR